MNKKTVVLIFGVALLFGADQVSATLPSHPYEANPRTAYREYVDVTLPEIVVPTVVELPISSPIPDRREATVYDLDNGSYVPSFWKEHLSRATMNVSISGPHSGSDMYLSDGYVSTAVDFPVKDLENLNEVEITIRTNKPVTSEGISYYLARNVSLPTTVSVSVTEGGSRRIVVSPTKPTEERVRFARTTASIWHLRFSYSQPLRITDISLNQLLLGRADTNGVRFLAQPGGNYRVYIDPAISPYEYRELPESGDLRGDEGVLFARGGVRESNPLYIEPDFDQDGIPDRVDNCVRTANEDQKDVDGNGRGDVCDDYDRDGKTNDIDNCPNEPNSRQLDEDGDGIGDVCDDEESRVTERLPWLPWVGIGGAALVLLILIGLTAKMKPPTSDGTTPQV